MSGPSRTLKQYYVGFNKGSRIPILMRRPEAATSDAEPREQTKSRRRSAGEVSPARLDVFRPHAFEPTVATWQLIVFAVISAVIPAVALLGGL